MNLKDVHLGEYVWERRKYESTLMDVNGRL